MSLQLTAHVMAHTVCQAVIGLASDITVVSLMILSVMVTITVFLERMRGIVHASKLQSQNSCT